MMLKWKLKNKIIKENFTAQVMSGRYQKLYDELLQNKAKAD